MSEMQLLLDAQSWNYRRRFGEPTIDDREVINRVEQYVVERGLERHPYFSLAQHYPAALMVWLSQELVMTNVFSQIVLFAASRLENVHVRAALTSVAYGEHGRLRRGLAKGAHPVLLDQLRGSVGLSADAIEPYPPTIEFVDRLYQATLRPLSAVAAIGVGNERLIFPEYQAVWRCFEKLFPDSKFAPFLNANLKEDEAHSKLCTLAALQLMQSEDDELEYEKAAVASVEARWHYFDGLEVIARSLI